MQVDRIVVLKVPTYLSSSKIHGIGVFAAVDIPAGTVVYTPGYERVYTANEFDQMPETLQKIVLERGWHDCVDGLYYLSMDNDQFMNHCDDANVKTLPNQTQIATRDVLKGEELTNNYHEFDLRVAERDMGNIPSNGVGGRFPKPASEGSIPSRGSKKC